MESKEVVLEKLLPSELTAKLFEEFISKGWRVLDQEVVGEEEGRLDVKVRLERETGAAGEEG